ncbi:hypothetical protein Cpir12675_003100 [Ceratocystis pirilliformis]|uniref:PIG-P domain-containing protein n=1 Tax=Ceratocystis pirilliformis TaxID=259994 RepID=A0ABR3Z6H1_9PEZI
MAMPTPSSGPATHTRNNATPNTNTPRLIRNGTRISSGSGRASMDGSTSTGGGDRSNNFTFELMAGDDESIDEDLNRSYGRQHRGFENSFDSSLSDGSDPDDDDDEDDESSHPWPHHQNDFAPPYYGRPPTPLPPSPSITSLLRPSRPTTPDASDDELEPVPRAAPRVPTYEYYGFILYLFSSLCFLTYLLWAFLPSPFLHALGITYYPDRWWALAMPTFLVVTLIYIYVALGSYNTEILTLPLTAVETVVDEAAQVALVDATGSLRDGSRMTPAKIDIMKGYGDLATIWSEGTDAVMDIPLGAVCEVLYARGPEVFDWEDEYNE